MSALHGYSTGRSKGETWSDLAHFSTYTLFFTLKRRNSQSIILTIVRHSSSFILDCSFFSSFPEFLFQNLILNVKYFGLYLHCPIFQYLQLFTMLFALMSLGLLYLKCFCWSFPVIRGSCRLEGTSEGLPACVPAHSWVNIELSTDYLGIPPAGHSKSQRMEIPRFIWA